MGRQWYQREYMGKSPIRPQKTSVNADPRKKESTTLSWIEVTGNTKVPKIEEKIERKQKVDTFNSFDVLSGSSKGPNTKRKKRKRRKKKKKTSSSQPPQAEEEKEDEEGIISWLFTYFN